MNQPTQLLVSFALLLAALGLTAQPTITNQIMIEPGSTAPVQNFSQLAFDPGPAGPNQSWDFGQLSPQGMPYDWMALEPANTSWGSSFPTATHAFHFPQDSMENMLYYRYDGDKLELLGTINAINRSALQDTFTYDFTQNPQTELVFPMNYQDQARDTAQGQALISFGGASLTVDRTIYRTLIADAYGSLTTPLGTYSEVLRVVIDEHVEDRSFGQLVTRQVNRRYYWYAPNEKYLLLQMDSLAVVPLLGPSSVSYNMFYRSGAVTTSLEQNLVRRVALKVFPNPATDQVSIGLSLDRPQPVRLELRNLQGQLVHEASFFSSQQASFQPPT
jgi:hypothetical protein